MWLKPDKGFTLPEIMVALVISGFVFAGIYRVITHFSRGAATVQRKIPVQRDFQAAMQMVERDLLSAPRSSVGNALIDGGFEQDPSSIGVNPSAPLASIHWYAPPRRMNPMFPERYAGAHRVAAVPGTNGGVPEGSAALHVWTFGNAYTIDSTSFTLVPGTHAFGGWARTALPDNLPRLRLMGGPAGAPSTVLDFGVTAGAWQIYNATFSAQAGFEYFVRAGFFVNDVDRGRLLLDGLYVIPQTMELSSPGSGERLWFIVMDGITGERQRMSYELERFKNSGRVLRTLRSIDGSERRLPYGAVNVKRLRLERLGGDAALLAQGLDAPFRLTLETGPTPDPLGEGMSYETVLRGAAR